MKNRVSSFRGKSNTGIVADIIFMVSFCKAADSSAPAVSKLTLQVSQNIHEIILNVNYLEFRFWHAATSNNIA